MCPLNGCSEAWQAGGPAHILHLWQKLQRSQECGTELLEHVITLSGWLMRLRGWGGVSDVLCLNFSKPLFLSSRTSSSVTWENKIQIQLSGWKVNSKLWCGGERTTWVRVLPQSWLVVWCWTRRAIHWVSASLSRGRESCSQGLTKIPSVFQKPRSNFMFTFNEAA